MDVSGESVRAVDRAVALLVVLGGMERPVGVSELSSTAGIPKTTTLRLLSALERHGLVQKEAGRYQLGQGIVSLAQSYLMGSNLAGVSLPILEWLARESGETTSLYVRQGYERVVVQRVESPQAVRYTLNIGRHLPLHLGASGHVLTAFMPPEELEEYLDRLGEVRTASGRILTRPELMARLERVRHSGFSTSQEERELGAAAVAAPVYLSPGAVSAAVAVIGPVSRVTSRNTGRLVALAQQAAREISHACGLSRSMVPAHQPLGRQAIVSPDDSVEV